MEISKHGKHLNSLQPHIHPATPAGVQAGESRASGEVKRTDGVTSQRLIDRLQDNAEVRDRQLAEIQARYLAGEYSTRAAHLKAAEQILGL